MKFSIILGGVAVASLLTSLSQNPTSGAVAPLKIVGCDSIIAASTRPWPDRRVLFGRVVLPRENQLLQGHAASENRPLPYFAKQGVQVRAGRTTISLIVPRRWRTRLAVGWGENGGPQQASQVRLAGCNLEVGRQWLSYPGGYFLRRPACAPLLVRVGTRSARIRLSLGRPCTRPR